MTPATFNKQERLKSRKSIEALFRTGRSFSSPPFRLIYRNPGESQPVPVRMTVAVPRRAIKKAVHRNLLKRRTREAFRLQNMALKQKLSGRGESIEILFLYQSTEIVDFRTIRKSVSILLARLLSEIESL